MPSFGNVVAPIPVNSLMPYASIQQGINAAQQGDLENQGLQQNLTDRATLRDLAPGLTARDPNAFGTAVSLGAPGQSAVGTLSNSDAQTAQTKLALLNYNNSLITYPTPPGGAAPQPGVGSPPGPAPASSADGSASSEDNFATALQGSENASGKPGTVNAQGYLGNFQFGTGRLTDLGLYQPAQGENPNGNKWQGTFSIPGFPQVQTYQDFTQGPVGQNGARDPIVAGQAQRAALHVQIADLRNVIGSTPGADKFNPDGLLAVGHLGGPQGLQKFVQTGGAYNPADANGTTLANYYNRFSQLGRNALGAEHGHPDGPLPGYAPTNAPAPGQPVQTASAANTTGMPQTATDASGPGSPDSILSTALTALRNGQASPTAGQDLPQPQPGQNSLMPYAQQGAGAQQPVRVGPSPASPTSPGASTLTLDQNGQSVSSSGSPPGSPAQPLPAGSPPPGGAPQPGSQSGQNGLMPYAALNPGLGAGPAQPNALSPAALQPSAPPYPQAPQPPQSQPVQPPSGIPPGAVFARTGPGGSRFVTEGLPPGTALARLPDGSTVALPIPGSSAGIDIKDSGNQRQILDKRTGQVLRTETIPDHSRMTFQETPNGFQGYQSGQPVGAPIPFSGRKEQNEAYESDKGQAQQLVTSAQAAQGNITRLNEMADLAGNLSTGSLGDFNSKAQVYLESLGVAPDAAAKLTGMSSGAAAQEFGKLAIATSGGAARGDLGQNNGIEAVRLYQSANPGLNLLPDANKRVINQLRVAQQSTQDYAQAALQHFGDNETAFLGGKQYAPLTAFNRAWQAQNNPQVYAAATGILNGDPFEKWSARLSDPAMGKRAVAIAARIDPNVQVPGRGGGLKPAAGVLGQQQPQPVQPQQESPILPLPGQRAY